MDDKTQTDATDLELISAYSRAEALVLVATQIRGTLATPIRARVTVPIRGNVATGIGGCQSGLAHD
jgi:hypothetical protein